MFGLQIKYQAFGIISVLSFYNLFYYLNLFKLKKPITQA